MFCIYKSNTEKVYHLTIIKWQLVIQAKTTNLSRQKITVMCYNKEYIQLQLQVNRIVHNSHLALKYAIT